jgi:hypothetical protein
MDPIIPAKMIHSLENSAITNYIGIQSAYRINCELNLEVLAYSHKLVSILLKHQFSLDLIRIVVHTIILWIHNTCITDL